MGTAVLLTLSVGAWSTLLFECRSKLATYSVTIGFVIVVYAVYLTGSRLGMLSMTSAAVVTAYWWVKLGRPQIQIQPVLRSLFICLAVIGLLTAANSSVRQTFITSTDRAANTIPSLIKGTPDPSFAARLAEYEGVELNLLGNPAQRNTEWTSEFLIVLTRFGILGLLLSWQIWTMLFTRAAKAAAGATDRPSRYLGVMASAAVVSGVVSALGAGSLLEPSRMILIVATVGLVPVVRMIAQDSAVLERLETLQPEK